MLYKWRDDRTDFYNEFMTKPDIFCSKEHLKMKFWMALETEDFDNIPKGYELFGKRYCDFNELDDPHFTLT